MTIHEITNLTVLENFEDKRVNNQPQNKGTIKKVELEESPQEPLIDGMSPNAHKVYEQQQSRLTNEEVGVNERTKIVVPSFRTTSKLFSQHFYILRELKHKIELLKQAYED